MYNQYIMCNYTRVGDYVMATIFPLLLNDTTK